MTRPPLLAAVTVLALLLPGCAWPDLWLCVNNGDDEAARVGVRMIHVPSNETLLEATVDLPASTRMVGQPHPSRCFQPEWRRSEAHEVTAWTRESTASDVFTVEQHVVGVHVEVLLDGRVHVSHSVT